MTYELAKQLKDAGFSNIRMGDYFAHSMGSHSDTRDSESCYCNEDHFPTLSELIEAVDEFSYLADRRYRGLDWVACGGGSEEVTDKTPEEAVAKLWLALNKK
jgi:hypothetical protein